MFLGRQLRQDVKVLWRFRDCSIPETSENSYILKWLSVQEHFNEFCRRESFQDLQRVFSSLSIYC